MRKQTSYLYGVLIFTYLLHIFVGAYYKYNIIIITLWGYDIRRETIIIFLLSVCFILSLVIEYLLIKRAKWDKDKESPYNHLIEK